MNELIQNVIYNFIGAAVGAFYGALIIQLGTKFVAKFRVPYRRAYIAAFLGYAVSFIVGLVLGIIYSRAGIGFNYGVLLFFMIVGFLTQAAVYSFLVKGQNGESLGFGKACLVSIIQVIAGIFLILFIGIIFHILKIKP